MIFAVMKTSPNKTGAVGRASKQDVPAVLEKAGLAAM
jgi:hypothetical protein